MSLLGIDVGTTHCKGAIFDRDGNMRRAASRRTPTRTVAGEEPGRHGGQAEHDPEEVWETVGSVIRELTADGSGGTIEAVGVASMAEAGCLLDCRTLRPRTPIIPWYDTRSTPQAEYIARRGNVEALFARTGLYPSYKHGLAKLLWIRDHSPEALDGAVWLSVADWIVFRLTAKLATDPTLAARTYLFNLRENRWDRQTLAEFDLPSTIVPEVLPSGSASGGVTRGATAATGLPLGVPAAVSGHDHVCTLLAAGVLEPGPVLDSMGTAESLIGVLDEVRLGKAEIESGLSFVPHVLPGRYCWLGGISSAGGSVEWLRRKLGLTDSYEEVIDLVRDTSPGPSGILFFPYLAGSGAPWPDQRVRAAFIGLSAQDERGDLLKAVIEGTCFELECMRQAAETLTGMAIRELYVVGGGARNEPWVQIKSDVTGCVCSLPALPEATALGAALAVGLGSGSLAGTGTVARIAEAARFAGTVVEPDPERHRAYRRRLEEGYLPLQGPLRAYSRDDRGRSGQPPVSRR